MNRRDVRRFCRPRQPPRTLPIPYEDRPRLPVVLTALRVFNEPIRAAGRVRTAGELAISHRDRVVTLEFAALDYTFPRRNQYAYVMEERGAATSDGGRSSRLFAWLRNFRRIAMRFDFHDENYLGFVHLGCIRVLLRCYV